jgi:hypothetical protein
MHLSFNSWRQWCALRSQAWGIQQDPIPENNFKLKDPAHLHWKGPEDRIFINTVGNKFVNRVLASLEYSVIVFNL